MKKMKKLILIALAGLMSLGLFAQENNKNSKSKDKTEVTFSVPLDCQNCVKKVESNIAFEKGVKGLECDLENKTVKVTYRKDKNDVDGLKNAFEKIGYPDVKVVEEKKDSPGADSNAPGSSSVGHSG